MTINYTVNRNIYNKSNFLFSYIQTIAYSTFPYFFFGRGQDHISMPQNFMPFAYFVLYILSCLVSTIDVDFNAVPIHETSRCAYRSLYSRLIRSRIEDQSARRVVINIVEITASWSREARWRNLTHQEERLYVNTRNLFWNANLFRL